MWSWSAGFCGLWRMFGGSSWSFCRVALLHGMLVDWSLAKKILHLNIFNLKYVFLLYLSNPTSKTWKEKRAIRGPLWATEQSKDHSNSLPWPYFIGERIFFIFRIFSSSAITLFPPLPIFSLDWMFEEDQQTGSNGATHAWKQGCL